MSQVKEYTRKCKAGGAGLEKIDFRRVLKSTAKVKKKWCRQTGQKDLLEVMRSGVKRVQPLA